MKFAACNSVLSDEQASLSGILFMIMSAADWPENEAKHRKVILVK